MRIIEAIDCVTIQEHMKASRSGVSLEELFVSSNPGEYQCFKGELDASDLNKLILWWENQEHTVDGNCRLTSLLPSASALPRVRSFIEGDPSRGLGPLDLTSASNMELVLVTTDVLDGWLYIIDGNNRAIAQTVRNMPFQGVPVLVYSHPAMHRWVYIPAYYKILWNLN